MQLLPRDRLKRYLFRPVNPKGLLPIVFEQRPRVYAFLNSYLLVILFGYSGIVAAALSLELSWLHAWISWWSPLADFLALFLPAFDRIERALNGTDYADRVGVVHHIMTVGWITTFVVVPVMIVLVIRTPRNNWRRVAQLHSRWWLASIGFVFLVSLFVVLFILGLAPQYRASMWLGAWHRSELQLMILALCFYAVIITAVGTILAFGALLSWSNDDAPEN
jgi:hypothetical protein